MIIKYYLFFILLISTSSLSLAKALKKETLTNGKTIIFYEISDKSLSKKQLKKIEKGINNRIKSLSSRFKKQSPKENLSSLFQLKTHLDNIYKKQDMKYAISNTRLNSRILLLSSLLTALPDKTKFQLKHCQQYIHRLRVKAHVSVNSNNLNNWVSQILELSEQLCPKNKRNQLVKLITSNNKNHNQKYSSILSNEINYTL